MCFLQNISFLRYSLHLWVRWSTHERKRDHAYSKNLAENVLSETYPDLCFFLVKHCGWQHVVTCIMTNPRGPQDCRVRITQTACRMCALFTVFISQNLRPTWKWVMSAMFWSLSAVSFGICFCMFAANVDLCSFVRVKRWSWRFTCVWNWAEWRVVLKAQRAALRD